MPIDSSRLEGTAARGLIHRFYAVAGCGGVGSWVAYLLGMSGASEIWLYDPEMVEPSNLTRTPYRQKDVGRPKVEALWEIIHDNNPHSTVVPIEARITDGTVFPPACSMIFNCVDSLASEAAVFRAAQLGGHKRTILRLAYDYEQVTITGRRPDLVWDSAPTDDGYEVEPSWAGPSVIAAVMGILAGLGHFRVPRDDSESPITFDPTKLHLRTKPRGAQNTVTIISSSRGLLYFRTLARAGQLSVSGLSRRMRVMHRTATRWMNWMVQAGLARRARGHGIRAVYEPTPEARIGQ